MLLCETLKSVPICLHTQSSPRGDDRQTSLEAPRVTDPLPFGYSGWGHGLNEAIVQLRK